MGFYLVLVIWDVREVVEVICVGRSFIIFSCRMRCSDYYGRIISKWGMMGGFVGRLRVLF